MGNRTFIRMKDVRVSLVGLATRLGYKVYKESVDYEEDSPARYMVKNKDGIKFTGMVLNATLAEIIRYDMDKSHVQDGCTCRVAEYLVGQETFE